MSRWTVLETVSETSMETGSGEERLVFKVPHKRKSSVITGDLGFGKKMDKIGSESQGESGSDSESDCSVSLSQIETMSRCYELDDIKLFLKSTKNRRGVRVDEYFPDVKQFIEKTRYLMAEGSFTNKEIYRLRKLMRKINTDLSDGADK